MPATPLLAIRHMGYYGALNESFGRGDHPSNELARSAHENGVGISPLVIGLFYRIVTPTETIRCIEFDAGT